MYSIHVFYIWPYGRFTEIQSNLIRNKFRRTNQGSNFLGGSFSNIDNVRAPVQFRRENQPQHFKRGSYPHNRPIHFHINSTSVFRPVKQNQLSFSSIEINKLLPALVWCLVGQIQVQKPILVVATDHMSDHIQSREQYHQHRQQYCRKHHQESR